jgi:hypothetical protein
MICAKRGGWSGSPSTEAELLTKLWRLGAKSAWRLFALLVDPGLQRFLYRVAEVARAPLQLPQAHDSPELLERLWL